MKKSIIILITLLLTVCLVSCTSSKNAEGTAPDSSGQTSAQQAQSTTQQARFESYDTKRGTIFYPAEYKDDFIIDKDEDKNSSKVTFSAKVNDTEYELFSLTISDKKGENVGVITDSEGKTHYVFAAVQVLQNIDALDQEQQDKLYAMQESINDIVDRLK